MRIRSVHDVDRDKDRDKDKGVDGDENVYDSETGGKNVDEDVDDNGDRNGNVDKVVDNDEVDEVTALTGHEGSNVRILTYARPVSCLRRSHDPQS